MLGTARLEGQAQRDQMDRQAVRLDAERVLQSVGSHSESMHGEARRIGELAGQHLHAELPAAL
ncbi:MAG: hypothetical protein WKG07_35970, partial [Hymenobacter sp.]